MILNSRMPFPMKNREQLFSEWFQIIDERQAVIAHEDLVAPRKKAIPKGRGKVRGKIYSK